jgi:hypothetical protein
MRLLVLIPTRGDRPLFEEWAVRMVGRQTQGAAYFLINADPKDDVIDIVERVQIGCRVADEEGFDAVVMWEDDDYYPPTYLRTVAAKLEQADIVAPNYSTYYNVRHRRWREMQGPSLFEMAWRVKVHEHMSWPPPGKINVDRCLMRGWREAGYTVHQGISAIEDRPIGIKHGVGKCAGVGHRDDWAVRGLPNVDLDMEYLRSRVQDEELLDFYAGFYDGP